MEVGDLVDYYGKYLAVVLYVNDEGGTIKAHLTNGCLLYTSPSPRDRG